MDYPRQHFPKSLYSMSQAGQRSCYSSTGPSISRCSLLLCVMYQKKARDFTGVLPKSCEKSWEYRHLNYSYNIVWEPSNKHQIKGKLRYKITEWQILNEVGLFDLAKGGECLQLDLLYTESTTAILANEEIVLKQYFFHF